MAGTKRSYWRKLDNAAKIFPATSNKNDTRVFRFYCELKEDVQEDKLQEAVNRTLKKYPVFLSVMRRGLFWHYLEKSALRPVVREEHREPCANLYVKDKKSLLFEVTYYKKRISFEVFHALTDGTGATEFLREVVKNYLVVVHGPEGLADIPLLPEDVTIPDQENDSFDKYYSKDIKPPKVKKPKAFQIKKTKQENRRLRVTEVTLSVTGLLNKSRELGVSMTILLTAVFLCAIHDEMTKLQEKRPIILMVPVNLRKFFRSKSMLNFFGWIEPGYQFGQGEESFEDVLESVKSFFTSQLTVERMSMHINNYTALEHHPILRLAPLEFKNLCINAGARLSEKDVTAIFSNMSVVTMPEEYHPYINRFGVFTSTPKIELCMCSFDDTVTLGFTSRYDSTNIQRNFLHRLKDLGVPSTVEEPDFPPESEERLAGIKFLKGFSFACLIAVVAFLIVEFGWKPQIHWSLFAAGGVGSMWLALAVGFYKRNNLLKNGIWQLVVITVACVIWDAGIGWSGWSVNWVLPCVCMAIMISMLVISRIQAHTAREYMVYYVMASGYSFVLPLILLLTGVVQIALPSMVCVGFSFIFLMWLLIFKGRELKEEMDKTFHV